MVGMAPIAGATAMMGAPSAAQAQIAIGIAVNLAPPALPIYVQPPIPGPDYIWQPGFWAWNGNVGDYYWVPGTWILAPRPGLLWTPGYWGWGSGAYFFHQGYWGAHVGYYGGVSYGFGYTGNGYAGGYWNNNHFFYNRSVNNVTNIHITNVYNRTVIVNRGSRASFNGPGGVTARPTQQELAFDHQQHLAPTALQQQHINAALAQQQFRASANHGLPPVAATARPATFQGPGVVAANHAGGAFHAGAAAGPNVQGGRQGAGRTPFNGQHVARGNWHQGGGGGGDSGAGHAQQFNPQHAGQGGGQGRPGQGGGQAFHGGGASRNPQSNVPHPGQGGGQGHPGGQGGGQPREPQKRE